MKNLKILFIGNSHTYYNDMPQMVRQRASEDGYGCHVTMLAHGGWFLSQHAEEPEPGQKGCRQDKRNDPYGFLPGVPH